MRNIRILLVVGTFLVLLAGGLGYIWISHEKKGGSKTVSPAEEAAAQTRAEELLTKGKADEALLIIHQYENRIGAKTEMGRKWVNLLIEAAIMKDDYGKMVMLYESYPLAFLNNERASLIAADGYILEGKPKEYEKIRDAWRDHATLKDLWLILDSDALLMEGKREEAKKLLLSTKFEGTKDIDRLVRLAQLDMANNPHEAWEYLTQAYNLNPNNPTILSFRGKFLEAFGQGSIALYEYLAAVQADPNDPNLRDQLAEYYMRHNQPKLALAIWMETLAKPSPDSLWIKALFWEKAAAPMPFDWKKAAPPAGPDKPFILYLASLPKDTFWDEEAFNKLSNGNRYLSNIQATFWLRLLQALKDGKQKEAYDLLRYNNFKDSSLNPQLEKALYQTLTYRLTGSLNEAGSTLENSNPKNTPKVKAEPPSNPSTFLEQIDRLAAKQQQDPKQDLPPDVKALLTSPEAFSALFLTAGWLEAALQLNKMAVIPENLPSWVAYGLTQALRVNRSTEEALAFALKQKKNPALTVLIGELYLAAKQPDKALEILEPSLKDPAELGVRAAWLVSLIYADKHEYEKAKKTIESNPRLAEDVLGKEGLARIALLQGNQDLAAQLYDQISDKSPEALSFLARKAFAEKNWKRAQELTQKLLIVMPDNPTIRENLAKILEEEKKQAHENKD